MPIAISGLCVDATGYLDRRYWVSLNRKQVFKVDGRRPEGEGGREADVTGDQSDSLAALAAELLLTPETLYNTLFEHVPAIIYVAAPEDPGKVLFFSSRFKGQLGYTAEEWLSDPYFWQSRLHPDDCERVLAADRESAAQAGAFDLQYRLIHRDGHTVWIRDQGTLIRDEHGIPRCWFGFTLDVSDQKQVEEALRQAEQRYRTLVEQIPAVTFTVSVDQIHHPIYLSPQVEAMFGYSREEWREDPEFWLKLIHPDDLAGALADVERAGAKGEPFSYEYRMQTRDGRTVWIQNDAALVQDAEGNPSYWQGVLLDITARKSAEEALREAEFRYRTLVEQISVVTFIEPHGGHGIPNYVSPQIETLLGYSQEYWLEHPDIGVRSIHPDDYARWKAEIERTDRTGEPFELEYRMIAADGRTVWVRSVFRLVHDEEGRPRFWHGIMQDVTDEVLADQRLAESEQHYRSLFDHNPDPVYSFDLDGNLRSANAALSDVTGYSIEEALDMSFARFVAPEDLARVRHHFDRAALGETQSYECAVIRRDGTRVDVHVTNLPIVVGGEIVGVYGVAKDISERNELERQLRHMAFHDPLTGLPNRVLFMDRLRQALEATRRRSTSIAVLFVDLDNFKWVNDSLGHEIGDRMLRRAAHLIQSCVRAGDTASRLGGDEFTVLLIEIENVSAALEVAGRIIDCFKAPHHIDGHLVSLTVSIGITINSSPDDDPETLLRHGDIAMYRAKDGGKARYALFSDIDRGSHASTAM